MIGRVLLAALLAGIAAGLVMGAIQHVRLTPLIVAAEAFEHGHAAGGARALLTTVTLALTGEAFAAVLAGISLVSGIALTPRNSVIWGLCGFLAVTLAPAAGLPPELPGMPAGDLRLSQLWWLGTIIATGLGIFLVVKGHAIWAVVLITMPHVIGAPVAASQESAVPAGLAAAFAANSIAAGAVFWILIGLFLGLALDKLAKEAA